MINLKRRFFSIALSVFYRSGWFCGLSLGASLPLSGVAAEPITAAPGETVSLEASALFDLPPNVVIETNLGEIPLELTPEEAPGTVANFLRYVDDGLYADSFIHRSVSSFVIQGGGFFFDRSGDQTFVDEIPTFDPIANEPNVSNTRGTVAMAKLGGDPDSATSQWFVNLDDNGSILDDQNGGFTVFAQVVGDGMNTVDAIAALQSFDASEQLGSPFGELPLTDNAMNVENFVTLSTVRRVVPEITVSFPEDGADYFNIRDVDGVLSVDVLPETPSGSYRMQVEGTTLGGTSEVAERMVEITAAELPWYAAADELENGWRFFDWFKGFRPGNSDWIFHARHGWLFVQGDSPAGLFLWDAATNGWFWTSETVYPWMYVFGEADGWLFFFEGGRPGSRFFKRADTGEVVSESQLVL